MKTFCAVCHWSTGPSFCVFYRAEEQATDEEIVAGLRHKWGSLAECCVTDHEEVPAEVPTFAEAFAQVLAP